MSYTSYSSCSTLCYSHSLKIKLFSKLLTTYITIYLQKNVFNCKKYKNYTLFHKIHLFPKDKFSKLFACTFDVMFCCENNSPHWTIIQVTQETSASHTFAKTELWSSKMQNIDPLLKQTSFRTPGDNLEMIHPVFHLLHLLKWESQVQHACIWQRLNLNLQHDDLHTHQNPCSNKGSFFFHAF